MSNAVAARKDERARRKAERMMEKQREAAEHDLPRSMRPSPITKTITVIVLVVAESGQIVIGNKEPGSMNNNCLRK